MNAVEYFKEAKRMCISMGGNCPKCPFYSPHVAYPCKTISTSLEITNPEKAVEIVEKWAAEHPPKTRQTEFLKVFPNARITIDDTSIGINPCYIDATYTPREDGCVNDCNECRKKYWNEEVDDDK